MATRGSYVHNSMVDFSGASPQKKSSIFQNIDGFRQNNSQGFLEPVQLCKQNPLEKCFIFTIYQNYTLALSSNNLPANTSSRCQEVMDVARPAMRAENNLEIGKCISSIK